MAKFLVGLHHTTPSQGNLFRLFNNLLHDLSDHLFVGMIVKNQLQKKTVGSLAGDRLPEASDFEGYYNEDDFLVTEAISHFETNAKDYNVHYDIYNDFELSPNDIIEQSTYADLLILSYELFRDLSTGKSDLTGIYHICRNSKCPVLILPANTTKIDNIIFTYDNKESSVFAIKAFSSLFAPTTRDKIVSILTVTPSLDEEIKNEKLLLNLVKQHYRNVGIQMLEGNNISKEIGNFALGVKNPMVVMGAFGRSHLSNLLTPSVAQSLVREANLPLFISHR